MLETKIDKIIEQQAEMNVTLAKLSVVVEEHEKRSTNLEAVVLPIQKQMIELNGVIKFFKLLGLLAAIAEAISLIIRHM